MGLADFSHCIVVYVFDKAAWDDSKMSRRPRGNKDWPEVGIFAQRAKDRPNRLGVTVCRVLEVKDSTVRIAGLDAIDGTPVVDIKPDGLVWSSRRCFAAVMVKRTDEGLLVTSRARGLLKPMTACLPLVTALNCVCLLIRTCCSTTKCGRLRERGTTTSVPRRQTSCVLLVVSSPTSSVASRHLCQSAFQTIL